MQKKVPFRFERFDVSRTQEIIDLYATCFGVQPNDRYYAWKLANNPAGHGDGFMALDGDILAGFHGVIPEEYLVNGKKRIIYQAVDAMTHPNYRRMGLFVDLALHTYHSLFEQFGSAYILATPGSTSHPGFVKMKFTDITYVRFLFAHKLAFQARNALGTDKRTEVLPINSFHEANTACLKGMGAPAKPISKYVDAAFLNWRFVDAPLGAFQCLECQLDGRNIGIAVYRMENEDRAFIQYVAAAEPEDFVAVVKAVTRYLFRETGVSFAYVFEPTDPSLHKAFRKNGYLFNPFGKGPFSYRPPISLYSNNEKIDGVNFFDVANWDIQAVIRDY